MPRGRDPSRGHAAGARRRRAGAACAAPAAGPARRRGRGRRRVRRDRERPPRRTRHRAARCSRSAPKRRCVTACLPTRPTANPVDLAGAGEQDVFSFAHTTRALLGDDGVDAVLFTAYFGGYSTLADELGEPELAAAELLGQAMAESGKPLVVHTMHWNTPPSRALRAAGVPVYRAIESAVDAIAALVADGAADPLPLPSLPAPAAPLTDSGYAAARAALAEAGIPFGPARTVEEPGRGARRRRRARLPGRAQGARPPAQVRRRRRRARPTRRASARRRVRRHQGQARSRVVLARGRRGRGAPASSCSSALAATRASGRSSWSPRAGSRPSSPATPR